MNSPISFHPVDPEFFEATIEPLVLGEKVDPGSFLEAALCHLVASWESARYKKTLDLLLEQLEPPPAPADGTVWDKVRTRLERFDHKPDPLVRLVGTKIEPDLHLAGRPYLITEGSAESVAAILEEFMSVEHETGARSLIREQLVRLDPEIARAVEPEDCGEPPPPGGYRAELLNDLRWIYDIARAARDGRSWGPADGRREPARAVLARELPWRAIRLHARAVPFWIGRDVDGLDALCRAASVEPPPFLTPAARLLSRSCDEYPELRERLGVEIDGERSLGGYVAPGDVEEMLTFLNVNGSRIIRAATRQGVGPTCKTLLRKIRETACFAARAGVGYVEASGIFQDPTETDPSLLDAP